jgi:hypothetical protein
LTFWLWAGFFEVGSWKLYRKHGKLAKN